MSEENRSGTLPTNCTDIVELPAGSTLASSLEATNGLDLRGYELIEPLGEGGMGEVYRCCDPALSRDLAIKVMKADFPNHSENARRFLREARVTGSLQHPGIVAVHNLGRLADGRLHYTMRLVRGRTFADILKEEAGKPERLPSLLAIFEKVCEAVAYAHSKRVIHRDLKPANIMVGKFGEVQVMDWGLAKLLTPEGEPAGEGPRREAGGTLIHTEAADTPPDLTRAGSGMGTPAYMSPEQAAGDWELVDERADVFALGAILCAMLTGQPPYRGEDGNEVLRRARRGELAEAWARLERCGADAALTGLCQGCLAVERQQRPRHAGVVAQRVADYEAEVETRLRQAELERTEAQVKTREECKRRRLALLLSAAVLLVFVAGTLISTLFAVDAGRQAGAARKHAEDATRAKQKADDNAKRAKEKERIATEAREKAETTLIAGLLRPMGRTVGPLSPLEVEALTLLRDQPDDRIHVRFIEEGLRTAETAQRLDRRAAWVIQAAVGLDARRRRQVQEVLMRHLRQKDVPDEVRVACVSLGIALDVEDPAFDKFAGEIAVAETVKSINRKDPDHLLEIVLSDRIRLCILHNFDKEWCKQVWELGGDKLSELLAGVSNRLDAAAASNIVKLLVGEMGNIGGIVNSSKPHDFGLVLGGIRIKLELNAVIEGLNAEAATHVAEILLAERNKTNKSIIELSNELQAVSKRLDASTVNKKLAGALEEARVSLNNISATDHASKGAEAATLYTRKSAQALIAEMGKIKQSELYKLISWLEAVSRELDEPTASKFADALLTRMSEEAKHASEEGIYDKANEFKRFSQVLQSLNARLAAGEAAALAKKATDILLALMDKTLFKVGDLITLSRGLEAVSERMDAADTKKVANALVKLINKYSYPDNVPLSIVLQTVSGRLNDGGESVARAALWVAICKPTTLEARYRLMEGYIVAKEIDPIIGDLDKVADVARGYALFNVWIMSGASAWSPGSTGLVLIDDPFAPRKRNLARRHNLDAAEARKIADKLSALISKTSETTALVGLSQALQALSRHLDSAAAANKATDALLAAMSKTTDPEAFYWLSEALQVIRARLDAATAAAQAGKSAAVLLAATSMTNDPLALHRLSKELREVCERLSTLDIVALLRHHLAAGPAQHALLDVLGHRTRRHFRNIWHFLYWARSNGVDFAPGN